VREGDDARRAVAAARRKTTSRAALARNRRFAAISPEPGQLDETAFAEALDADPDAALSLLADLTGATDVALRELARRLAGRIAVRLARTGPARTGGVGRLRRARWQPGADIDLDRSLDRLALSATAPPSIDELDAVRWGRASLAVSLVVDRSGSMGGPRLASAALAAATLSYRAPDDWSALAFADDVVVVKGQDESRAVDAVVDDLLALRGHGTTDLALALRTARAQLARSPASRRVVVLLSDGRPTAGGDPGGEARALAGDLVVLAPAGDADDAVALAAAAGGRCVEVAGPASVPGALASALG
jgi:Mg-chelatase subunit ChlD